MIVNGVYNRSGQNLTKLEEQQKRNANWVFAEPATTRAFSQDENNVFGYSGVW
jgi:hypothetical protein